jgi:hypothetical protein
MSLRKEGVRASAPRRTPMHSTTRRQSMYCPGQGPGELRARPAPRAGRASCHACAAQGGPSGLRRRPWSVVPGEARHAQRLLLVIVGIVRLTYANASAGVDRDRCRRSSCHAFATHGCVTGPRPDRPAPLRSLLPSPGLRGRCRECSPRARRKTRRPHRRRGSCS